MTGAKTVTPQEAKALFDQGAYFVDPRRNSDWDAGRVPDAIHLDLKTVFSKEALMEEVKLDESVVFYCNGPTCGRAAKAAGQAVSWGYSKVFYLYAGFPGWKSAGYPVE